MEDLRKYRNRILKYAGISAAAFWLISIPFVGMASLFPAGLFLGTLATGVNFVILEQALEKVAGMEEQKAKSYILKNYMMRALFYGIIFFLCWGIGTEAAMGCIAGLFTTKVAIYTDGFINRERK